MLSESEKKVVLGEVEFLGQTRTYGGKLDCTNALRHAPGTKTLKHQSHAIIHARKDHGRSRLYIYIYIYIIKYIE